MEQIRVERLASRKTAEDWIRKDPGAWLYADPGEYDPGKTASRLRRAAEDQESYAVWAMFRGARMIGVFAFLTLREENYLEMLLGLTTDEESYPALLSVLREQFPGCTADFVIQPEGAPLVRLLRQAGALFEQEQQQMVHVRRVGSVDTRGVELLSEPYIPAYLKMHDRDLYWTGERVLQAGDRFLVLAAVADGELVGYLDQTRCYEENEPCDLRVLAAYQRRGWGRKLLAKGLELNGDKGMRLHVDVDNIPAIRLYESLGFEREEKKNSVVAHLDL